jgi:hypothetical protein
MNVGAFQGTKSNGIPIAQKREYLQILLSKGQKVADGWLEDKAPPLVSECFRMSDEQIDTLIQFLKENPQMNERDYLTNEEKKKLWEIFE